MNESVTKKQAFTVLELVIVIIIVVISARMVIPVYTTKQARAYGSSAVENLRMIAAAQQIYRAERGSFVNCLDVTAINTNLRLNIIASGLTYNCVGAAITFTCQAIRSGPGGWTVSITETQANPVCTIGPCPI